MLRLELSWGCDNENYILDKRKMIVNVFKIVLMKKVDPLPAAQSFVLQVSTLISEDKRNT